VCVCVFLLLLMKSRRSFQLRYYWLAESSNLD
jgi:hypothetical protein